MSFFLSADTVAGEWSSFYLR